ncbi:MAG: hypothetical protein IIY06_01005 [Proteobacteria bacterium]|nr:hypothetical protein [Pseudomonadota bacterium]
MNLGRWHLCRSAVWLMVSVALSACVCAVASEAYASAVVALDGSQRAAMSDAIVHGVVLSSEPVVLEDGRLVTRHTVRVIRWVKADGARVHAETVHIYTRGGRIGDQVTHVSGEAQMDPGEEVVIYLIALSSDAGEKRYFSLGMAQGTYIVLERGEERRVVRSDVRMRRRASQATRARASVVVQPEVGDQTLDAFVAQIEKDIAMGLRREDVMRQLPARRVVP